MSDLNTFIEEKREEFRKKFVARGGYYIGYKTPIEPVEDFLESALKDLAEQMKGLVPEEDTYRSSNPIAQGEPAMTRGYNSCRIQTIKAMDEFISGTGESV